MNKKETQRQTTTGALTPSIAFSHSFPTTAMSRTGDTCMWESHLLAYLMSHQVTSPLILPLNNSQLASRNQVEL
jgi:hypothetical protein